MRANTYDYKFHNVTDYSLIGSKTKKQMGCAFLFPSNLSHEI